MNPYKNLPDKAFWKLSVSAKSIFDIEGLWEPKFQILPDHKVVSFGSCFAQHFGKALNDRGFNWHITEKPPHLLSNEEVKSFGYNIFSARTGNIYTTSLLKQWTEWALGKSEPPGEYWVSNNRIYDPFRPRIEPNGFSSETEMKQSRMQTIRSFKESIVEADYFVFTMGLTESWKNVDGYEYPMCPGTVAGVFDKCKHKFVNQQFMVIINNISDVMSQMTKVNPNIKFILTVSPVPLTATKTNRHVIVATMASKSILRAVADQLSTNRPYVDYFPSYEIINSPIFKGVFFEPNQRSINYFGVNFVMDSFFDCMKRKFGSADTIKQKTKCFGKKIDNSLSSIELDDEYCDEALLEAFGDNI